MPASIVKTKRDERLWAEAKRQAKAKKPPPEDFYAFTMDVFRRMKYRTGAEEPPEAKGSKKSVVAMPSRRRRKSIRKALVVFNSGQHSSD